MGEQDRPSGDVDQRVEVISRGGDTTAVAEALAAARTPILTGWLEAASRQPFHRERPDGAVADHIPALFDAIVDLLRSAPTPADGGGIAPLDDAAVSAAATAHAQARFEQGLGPVAVITEFRLLRQEIGRAMRAQLDDAEAATDVVVGLVIVGDALDGAATVGLSALSSRIETLRESFLATTLHDVRQPITLVEGSLLLADRWLGASDFDPTRLAEIVRDALVATEELVAIVDTLSDATRVAMGELDADFEPASLEAIVREAIEALGATGRERIRFADEGPHLIGLWDPKLIRRVVANLLNNALKYSSSEQLVEIALGRADESARLSVRDHGIGMAPTELNEVFDRFSRSDRARQTGTPGLGLGLYACRGIVVAHGGTIEVESDGVDRGTTVTVTLPLLDDENATDDRGSIPERGVRDRDERATRSIARERCRSQREAHAGAMTSFQSPPAVPPGAARAPGPGNALLAVLSHELRTPVTTIYAGSHMLASWDLDREQRQAVSTDVMLEAERLYRLVEDLLVLARLEAGALEAEDEPVNVGRAVTDAVGREVATREGVRIAVTGTRDVTAGSADRLFIAHVVRNLLDNAIRYGDSSGVQVVVESRPDEISVHVLDRGPSPAPGGPGAFDLATPGPTVPVQRAGGGIGLFVAGRLVAAMGGRIWATAREGGGSDIGFSLPNPA